MASFMPRNGLSSEAVPFQLEAVTIGVKPMSLTASWLTSRSLSADFQAMPAGSEQDCTNTLGTIMWPSCPSAANSQVPRRV